MSMWAVVEAKEIQKPARTDLGLLVTAEKAILRETAREASTVLGVVPLQM
jgi:hypothetical protein